MTWFRDPSGHVLQSKSRHHKIVFCKVCNEGSGRMYMKMECQKLTQDPVSGQFAEVAFSHTLYQRKKRNARKVKSERNSKLGREFRQRNPSYDKMRWQDKKLAKIMPTELRKSPLSTRHSRFFVLHPWAKPMKKALEKAWVNSYRQARRALAAMGLGSNPYQEWRKKVAERKLEIESKSRTYCPTCLKRMKEINPWMLECESCGHVMTRTEVKQIVRNI